MVVVEREYQSVRSADSDMRKKTAVLKMHSAKVAEQIECYDEYTKRMKHKLQTLNKTGYVRFCLH